MHAWFSIPFFLQGVSYTFWIQSPRLFPFSLLIYYLFQIQKVQLLERDTKTKVADRVPFTAQGAIRTRRYRREKASRNYRSIRNLWPN